MKRLFLSLMTLCLLSVLTASCERPKPKHGCVHPKYGEQKHSVDDRDPRYEPES